jgi:CrcB protein
VQWCWLFVGGGLGAVARFGLGALVLARTGEGFPWGTLVVNWSGCLAIGVLAAWLAATPHPPALRLFLVTGVLGGFTTFSAFGLETVELVASGASAQALLYVAGSVLGGLAAVALGLGAGRALG